MRIPTLLQKIGELADHPDRRTRIDVDLMLDYTRVLYADLLEWRDKLSAPAPNPVSAPIPATTRSSGPAPGPTSQVNSAEPNVPPGAQSTALPDQSHRAFQRPGSASPSTEAVRNIPEPMASQPSVNEPTLAELAAAMDRDDTESENAIRPVRPQASQPPVTINQTPPTTGKKEDREKKVEALSPAPTATTTANPPRDIRTSISINEKYQILSELFGNDKDSYEAALNRINSAESETATIKWLQEHLWVTEERSDAMQQFFDLVRQFKNQPEQGSLRFSV